jgi:hypothetical protein
VGVIGRPIEIIDFAIDARERDSVRPTDIVITIGAEPAAPNVASAMRRPSRDGTGSAIPASAAETTVA